MSKSRITFDNDELALVRAALEFYKSDKESNVCLDCFNQNPEFYRESAIEAVRCSQIIKKLDRAATV